MKLAKPITLAVFIFSILATFLYFMGFIGLNNMLLKAVPEKAVWVIEINDFLKTQDKLKNTTYWAEWQNINLFNKLQKGMTVLDSLYIDRQKVQQTPKIVVALAPINQNAYDFVFLMHQNVLKMPLQELIISLKNKGYTIETRLHRGITVYEFYESRYTNPTNTNAQFTITTDGKLLIGSFNSVLLEDAINNFRSFSGGFSAIYTQMKATDFDAFIHFNFKNFEGIASAFFSNSTQKANQGQKSNANFFDILQQKMYKSTIGLNFLPTQIQLQADAKFNEYDNVLNTVLNEPSVEKTYIASVLPATSAVVLHERVANFENFYTNQMGFFWGGNKNFKKYLMPLIANEWALGFTEPNSNTMLPESFLAIELNTKDTIQIYKAIHKYNTNNELINSNIDANYKNFKITNILAYPILQSLYSEQVDVKQFGSVFCTVINNFLILAPNQNTIKIFIEQFLATQTLNKEGNYAKFDATLDPNCNIMLYANLFRMKQFLKANANAEFANILNSEFEYYSKITPIALQANSENNNYINAKGLIGYSKKQIASTTLLWNISLEDDPATAPHILENKKTNTKEIAVSDKKNNLYIINANGQIKLKKNLDQPILNKVLLVDFYNTGNYQYLFNTYSHIYLLNADGTNATGFPLKLTHEATAGITTVELDRNNIYFFVPCRNSGIYGYELSGKPLTGFSPSNNLGNIQSPLQFYNNNLPKEKYLIATNTAGGIYIIDLQGNVLKNIGNNASRLAAPPQLDWYSKKLKVISTTTHGNTTITYPQTGESVTQNFCGSANSVVSDFFTANIIGSSTEESVLLCNGKIKVYNPKEKLFEYNLPTQNTPTEIFEVKIANADTKQIGALCKATNQIYLLQKYGKIHPNFPISATTAFVISDLHNANENILIAGGSEKNVFAYQIK